MPVITGIDKKYIFIRVLTMAEYLLYLMYGIELSRYYIVPFRYPRATRVIKDVETVVYVVISLSLPCPYPVWYALINADIIRSLTRRKTHTELSGTERYDTVGQLMK